MAGFSSTGKYGYFLDDNLEATLETVDIEFSKGGAAFINAMRLDGDCGCYNTFGQIGTRRVPGQTLVWSDSVQADTDTARIWIRAMGGTHRLRFSVLEGTDWTHANNATIWLRKAGNRA